MNIWISIFMINRSDLILQAIEDKGCFQYVHTVPYWTLWKLLWYVLIIRRRIYLLDIRAKVRSYFWGVDILFISNCTMKIPYACRAVCEYQLFCIPYTFSRMCSTWEVLNILLLLYSIHYFYFIDPYLAPTERTLKKSVFSAQLGFHFHIRVFTYRFLQ